MAEGYVIFDGSSNRAVRGAVLDEGHNPDSDVASPEEKAWAVRDAVLESLGSAVTPEQVEVYRVTRPGDWGDFTQHFTHEQHDPSQEEGAVLLSREPQSPRS